MQILVNCTNGYASFVASYRARGATHRVRSPTATSRSSSFVTHKLVFERGVDDHKAVAFRSSALLTKAVSSQKVIG